MEPEATGIKKRTRPSKRTNPEPENPNPPQAEGLGTGDGAGGTADTVGPVAEQADAAAEQPRRGRPAGSTNKAKAAAEPAISISAGEVGFVYDGLGALKMWVAVKFFGVPPDLAGILSYTEEEKSRVAEPTARVLSKLLPSIGKYKDEAALILGLYEIEQSKIMRLNAAMEERAAAIAAQPGRVVEMERTQ